MAKTGFQPSIIYQDPKAAMRWLEAAFGFEVAIYIEGDAGEFIHCQMRYGEALALQERLHRAEPRLRGRLAAEDVAAAAGER